MGINMQCYNCDNIGTTREHIIPKFFLLKGESGFFTQCCSTCREKLKWLDDYASDYFRYQMALNSEEEYDKWFKQAIIQNGSPLALRLFGEDIVINENILMLFIHKVCIGIAYNLYGRLNDSYTLNITTNFSQLGGFSQYNSPDNKSYSEKLTNNIIDTRNSYFYFLNEMIEPYSNISYETENVKLTNTGNELLNGATWFYVNFYKKYSIICAVVEGTPTTFGQSRNMVISSFPVRIDLDELEECRNMIIETEHGESIAHNLALSSISNESRELRKKSLLAEGVSINDIETFENSLTDALLNKGGKEKLAKMFIDGFKGKINFNK